MGGTPSRWSRIAVALKSSRGGEGEVLRQLLCGQVSGVVYICGPEPVSLSGCVGVSGECWGGDRECEFSCANGILCVCVCVCVCAHTLVLTQELKRIWGSLS